MSARRWRRGGGPRPPCGRPTGLSTLLAAPLAATLAATLVVASASTPASGWIHFPVKELNVGLSLRRRTVARRREFSCSSFVVTAVSISNTVQLTGDAARAQPRP